MPLHPQVEALLNLMAEQGGAPPETMTGNSAAASRSAASSRLASPPGPRSSTIGSAISTSISP